MNHISIYGTLPSPVWKHKLEHYGFDCNTISNRMYLKVQSESVFLWATTCVLLSQFSTNPSNTKPSSIQIKYCVLSAWQLTRNASKIQRITDGLGKSISIQLQYENHCYFATQTICVQISTVLSFGWKYCYCRKVLFDFNLSRICDMS